MTAESPEQQTPVAAKTMGEETIAAWCASVSRKAPTPGGGAVAAVVGAAACALGAMAARYTTGKRHAAVADEATALGDALAEASADLLAAADDDAAAYAAVQAADDSGKAAAERAAAAVPAGIIASCDNLGARLADFAPRCNRWLLSDLNAALHLLAGAAAAALEILDVNNPDADLRQQALDQVLACRNRAGEPQP